MPVEWAGSGPELLVTIDRGRGEGLRTQLENQLRAAIRAGRLTAGDPLPSSRELARALGLSRGLVQDGYAQLQAEGYLTSRPGSATRVAAHVPARPSPAPAAVAQPEFPVADFRHGVPDLGLVPRQDWAWAVREACRVMPDAAFDYGDAVGALRLREVLASYAVRVRAASATAADVIVCTGTQQALGLVVGALGLDEVAVEHPGSAATLGSMTNLIHVPVDASGLDVAALERSGARAVLVTPAHQWPTGVVLTGPRRQELIAWARACDGIIIEDDYDAEFRYDRDPVGSLQGLAPDRVVSLGTVSKSLAPALRLGWIIAPEHLHAPIARRKWQADRGSSVVDQYALAALIESGRYDRHLRRMRTEYAARRDTLVTALARHAPHLPLTGLAAGFHAVLNLPAGADEQHLISRAAERGVGLYGFPAAGIILGFGNTPRRTIDAGITAIADLLSAP
ncbi:PLP-dependent aminotransferase family protein [Actinoplanes sp. TRM 88003]|uniref:PLP-dependent aminotransferase family protein n=1 Tax=Paractinoplanes aksuensis TaxID=2939490 RepID=A0ABT1DES1_9ACTN|nr:PLP-dependent aminotransferase family protein [Actinoplanes aksuensis]MCO8269314.1 PLP-dependent aminotransferase family protein [Actinoplanes aksuensis]